MSRRAFQERLESFRLPRRAFFVSEGMAHINITYLRSEAKCGAHLRAHSIDRLFQLRSVRFDLFDRLVKLRSASYN